MERADAAPAALDLNDGVRGCEDISETTEVRWTTYPDHGLRSTFALRLEQDWRRSMSASSKRLGRLLVTATVLGGVWAVAAVAPTFASTNDADVVNQSVVWVNTNYTGAVDVPFTDGTSEVFSTTVTGYCTGWFVSDQGHIATAGHCLTAGTEIGTAMIAQVIAENNLEVDVSADELDWAYEINSTQVLVTQPTIVEGPLSDRDWLVAQIVAQEPFENGDNALLKVANLTETAPLTVATDRPEVGSDVVSVGYPASVDAVSVDNQQPPSQKRGSVSSHTTTSQGVPMTEVDAAVSGGMSGGPTLDSAGEVIGINSFGIRTETQPFNFVTDTATLRVFLERNGVTLDSAAAASEDGPASEAESNTGDAGLGLVIVALVALVAVLLIGGAVLLVVLLRRKKPAPAMPPEEQAKRDDEVTQ